MGRKYRLGRMRPAMARGAATAESRLVHDDLAGRYSLRAADLVAPAPDPPLRAPAPPAEARTVLHLPEPPRFPGLPGSGPGRRRGANDES